MFDGGKGILYIPSKALLFSFFTSNALALLAKAFVYFGFKLIAGKLKKKFIKILKKTSIIL